MRHLMMISAQTVTLHARVWIEIRYGRRIRRIYDVTLYARVWIEMSRGIMPQLKLVVTLYSRVWIEIDVNVSVEPKPSSPST